MMVYHFSTTPRCFSMHVFQICVAESNGVYKTEVLVWRLVICGAIWAQMSAWRWGTRVWEVNDE